MISFSRRQMLPAQLGENLWWLQPSQRRVSLHAQALHGVNWCNWARQGSEALISALFPEQKSR